MATEYRADRVIVLKDARGKALLSVIVEVQRGIDPRKRRSWPVYVTVQQARLACDVVLLVLCLDDKTAAWAGRPIDLGFGQRIHPQAVGPGLLPTIRSRPKAAEILGAGAEGQSSSDKSTRNQEGDPKDCSGASPDATKPPAQCGAAVRLELIAIAPAPKDDAKLAAPAPVQAEAPEVACPQGLVLTEGKCAQPAAAASFLCAPDNAAQCAEQCSKGNAGSCVSLAALHASGRGAPKDDAKAFELFKKGCDGGETRGCLGQGQALAAGRGTGKDPQAARPLLDRACKDGVAAGCGALGALLASGEAGSKDEAGAVTLLTRACEGGDDVGCGLLGDMLTEGRGAPADRSKAASFHGRACQGSVLTSCEKAGALRESSNDAVGAGILYRRACYAGLWSGCTGLERSSERGACRSAAPLDPRGHAHGHGASSLQGFHAGAEGGSGGEHVVHQQHRAPPDRRPAGEGPLDALATSLLPLVSELSGLHHPPQPDRVMLHAEPASDPRGQQRGLVVTALAEPGRSQRHRHHQVHGGEGFGGAGHQVAQGAGEVRALLVFQPVDRLGQRASEGAHLGGRHRQHRGERGRIDGDHAAGAEGVAEGDRLIAGGAALRRQERPEKFQEHRP
jgi:TPR repeat protein